MKSRDVEAPRPLYDLSKEARHGLIRLMSRGKPVAYVLLASHYDDEDIGYMTDPEFWKMIRDRRESDEGIPIDEAFARLEARERRERKAASSKLPSRSKKQRG
jgi:hypothetical protein